MRVPSSPMKNEAVREGASELSEKLRADFARLMALRRYASLQHTIGCSACDAQGTVPCDRCAGTGKTSVVVNDVQQSCLACNGTGTITCVECGGVGRVPNANRKKVIIMLVVGGLAWLYVLFRLWGGDVAPELRANLSKDGGGHATQVAKPVGGGRSSVGAPQQMPTGGTTTPQNGGYSNPQGGGGYSNPQGGGGYSGQQGGGYANPQGRGGYANPQGGGGFSNPQGGGGYSNPQGGGGYSNPQGGGGYSSPQGGYRR